MPRENSDDSSEDELGTALSPKFIVCSFSFVECSFSHNTALLLEEEKPSTVSYTSVVAAFAIPSLNSNTEFLMLSEDRFWLDLAVVKKEETPGFIAKSRPDGKADTSVELPIAANVLNPAAVLKAFCVLFLLRSSLCLDCKSFNASSSFGCRFIMRSRSKPKEDRPARDAAAVTT